MGRDRKRRKTTVHQWILKMVLYGLIFMTVMTLAVPWYAGHEMRRQAGEANEKLADVYLEFLDSSVEGINKVLNQFAENTYDVSVLARSTDELERYYATQNIMQKLKDASLIYHVFDGIFVDSRSAAGQVFLCQVGPGGSGAQVDEMKKIMEDYADRYSVTTWELVHTKDRDYLVRVVHGGATSCGAWIDVASLKIPFGRADFGETGIAAFLDHDGTILNGGVGALSGVTALAEENNGKLVRLADKKYLQIVKQSRILPVSVAVLVPEEEYLHNIYFVQNVIGILLAVSLLVFPLFGRRLKKSISVPVDCLVNSMNEVQKGNLDVQVETGGMFAEFEEMEHDFNAMVSEIRRLKKDVYERKISEQKTQLQYLQLQIRPHFFLNTLNVIYSFSLVKRNDLIEKMVSCLSKYFSYMFRSGDSFVSLREETEHMENFLELYRLRYQNQFLCNMEIEEVLLDAKVPPLVIQTFVENSLKYGLSQDMVFELELAAEAVTGEGEQKLKITVSDNGPGYEEAVMEQLRQEKEIKGSRGAGIGICNVMQRLRLLYHGKAEVRLSNIPGSGACSEIILPLEFTEEGRAE